jgi:hypothetical protein
MANKYVRLEGQDFGIIIGNTFRLVSDGIFLYKPDNNLVPNINMSFEEIRACVPLEDKKQHIKIPYDVVRQVRVNEKPVWRNWDIFDLKTMGIDPNSQVYWGRGNVLIEVIDNSSNLEEKLDIILQRNLGLKKIE